MIIRVHGVKEMGLTAHRMSVLGHIRAHVERVLLTSETVADALSFQEIAADAIGTGLPGLHHIVRGIDAGVGHGRTRVTESDCVAPSMRKTTLGKTVHDSSLTPRRSSVWPEALGPAIGVLASIQDGPRESTDKHLGTVH